jgi:serine/threonine-protein kinase
MNDVTQTGPVTFGEGRFQLRRALGTTPFGGVFEALDTATERRCAVKLHDRSATGVESSERFLAEARVLAEVQHPHVLHAWDHGCEQGFCWYAMELLPHSLRDHCKAKGRVPAEVATAALLQVLSALWAVHQRGLIHRDVKLTNVLVGRDGRVRLADFGVAHHPDGTVSFRTVPGQALGTPGYGAPEQWSGEEQVGPATDVFAAGVLLYRMLTGRPPDRMHLAHYRPRLLAEVPEPLHEVLLTATMVEPPARYPDALAMASAVADARAEMLGQREAHGWVEAMTDLEALQAVDWGRSLRWFQAPARRTTSLSRSPAR